MKIAYICNTLINLAGLERVWTDKINYLSTNDKYEVYLITASQGNHSFPFPLSAKVTHIDLNVRFHTQYQYAYPKRLWIKWKMKKDFKRKLENVLSNINPDFLITTTYWKADVVCNLQCKGKKIIESHCTKLHTKVNQWPDTNLLKDIIKHLQTWQYNRTIERKSDVLVALTQNDAQEWKKTKYATVIPNPVIPSPVQVKNYATRHAIAVGRLTYQKGFDLLIAAWKEVYDKHPDWKLDIFGEGDDYSKLTEQITTLGMTQSISIHHATLDIWNEYTNSSIYILSSRFEGFGLVLVEAMNCGVPCISFDCPHGPSEIITHKEDGLLVANGNIKELGDAICYLIENEKIRKEYGEKAKENAKRYLPENIMPQWEQLFNTLLEK